MATSGIGNSGSGEGAIRSAVLIAGPTASGKSALAVAVAERIGGVVVNADSMQVYTHLEIITARPGADDLSRVPHLLYGHVHPGEAHSTGAYVRDVARLAADGAFEKRRPVFVGGTGLYFQALLQGIADMPEIAPSIRERWRNRLTEEGAPALHRILLGEDPAAAQRLRPSDGQRIARALEVVEASGRSILDWQRDGGAPLVDAASAVRIVLEPPRAELVERIDRRFDAMLEAGALDEARALGLLGLDPDLPAMKAIGVPHLVAAARGEVALDEAVRLAKIATRQFAKRQATWFRNQLDDAWLRAPGPQEAIAAIRALV